MSTKARLRKMFESKSRRAFDRTMSHRFRHAFDAKGFLIDLKADLWDAWKAGAKWQKRQKP